MKIIWKPQIMAAMTFLLCLGIIAIKGGYPEIAASCPAGLIALGMKILEKE